MDPATGRAPVIAASLPAATATSRTWAGMPSAGVCQPRRLLDGPAKHPVPQAADCQPHDSVPMRPERPVRRSLAEPHAVHIGSWSLPAAASG